MYKLTDNTYREAQDQDTYQGTTWGNFHSFISRIHKAERQAEGWYSVIVQGDVTHPVADPGQDAIIIPMPAPIVVDPAFDISKLKLGRAFRSIGQEEAFEAYLASDSALAKDWGRAVSLRSDDPLVLRACALFKPTLGMTDEQLTAMLKQCRSD